MNKSILDFCEENKNQFSMRLFNWFSIQKQYSSIYPNSRHLIDLSKLMNDLTKNEFLSTRNVGEKTWEELQKIYKQSKQLNTMNKSLFNISKEAIELASLLEEGEYTPEIEQALAINQNELQEKAINYGYVVKSLESDVSAIDEEIKRLRSLKEAKTNAIDRMKSSVLNAMQIYGLKKIESPTLNVSIRESESVEVHSLEQLPDTFKTTKVTVSADKVSIKKAIKDGVNIEGAVIVTNSNLQIK
jgi:hypothetical protein